tara:strand:- start:447 stop:704 length:258 start_codon:yes stop_codon:yes gene_type:complete
MPYITVIKTIEKTVEYWVPDEIIDESHTNCGDSAYSYLASLEKYHPHKYIDEQEIDERIIDPAFPKTQVPMHSSDEDFDLEGFCD